ncbi:MAG: M20/M25/M40 family metallo-hydrolase [Candidatus Binatus sp.]|uniref:M20/M25/M40 family metallo-hydrolase n=1 Tax=Candidatus Binatus sp. TaxID=2811406 RepID=UPI00271F48E3|nr:M20/M25/M40 family metallo-hydrolase [Candidatus Binatus sp.]MDO8434497.1 M20/M25/M40 family metallo-hydrolase [Candidatus Binatus sp.]
MKVSWQTLQSEALQRLQDLIRLDTTNPPGNERIAADYLAEALGANQISSVIREGGPTRANLVARIAGRDASKGALLLSSHTDVVPVERSGWTREPFSGEIFDGCVWGRGSIDMKSKCAMDLAVMTAMKRAGVTPDRGVIMAAVADEEAGSDLGAKFLVERHPELVRADYVLNEVGGFTVHLGSRRFYPIQVAEKGFVTIKMKVTAPPGHGSMPRQDTAIARISELITKIVRTPMRKKVSPFMRQMLDEIGIPLESAGTLFQPMLANTVSPTILRAGYKDNVIPGEATIVLDGRTLPGEDPESFMAELREIVGPEPSFELLKTAPPAETSPDTPLFKLIQRRVEAADPGARAIAWMIPGATDNKFYSKLGAACYGFSPVKLEPHMPFGSLYHGNDERLPIAGFHWGLRVYAEVVLEFLGIKFDEVFN